MKEEEKVDIRSKFTEQLFEVEDDIVAGIQLLSTKGNSTALIIGSSIDLLNSLTGALKDNGPFRGLIMNALMMAAITPNHPSDL